MVQIKNKANRSYIHQCYLIFSSSLNCPVLIIYKYNLFCFFFSVS